jgi:hypothetical protein
VDIYRYNLSDHTYQVCQLLSIVQKMLWGRHISIEYPNDWILTIILGYLFTSPSCLSKYPCYLCHSKVADYVRSWTGSHKAGLSTH